MTRRFIAGAVCPRCSEQDKIVVDSGTDTRECVKCGYSDARPADKAEQDSNARLRTRVSRPAARRSETPAEVVTLLDPHSKDSS